MTQHIKLTLNVRRHTDGARWHESLAVTGRANVIYQQGVRAQAPDWLANLGYGLLVFANVWYAYNGANLWGNTIWLAECEEPMPLPPRLDMGYLYNGPSAEYPKPLTVRDQWPEGTLMFRYVTPIRALSMRESLDILREQRPSPFTTTQD